MYENYNDPQVTVESTRIGYDMKELKSSAIFNKPIKFGRSRPNIDWVSVITWSFVTMIMVAFATMGYFLGLALWAWITR